MASDQFKGKEQARFPALLAVGVLMAIVVIVVAFVVDTEIGIPVLILTVVCVAAALGFRLFAGSNRGESDSSDAAPRQSPSSERPLGDTPEAHDEVNPHDLPLDNPGRQKAEQLAGDGGTTRGHDEGGAAGRDGPGDQDPVGADESEGARP